VGVDAEALAVARRIRERGCAKVGLVPLHARLELMPTARRLARAFEVLGDLVDLIDTQSPPAAAERAGVARLDDRPAALERALEDSGARFGRVLVVFGALAGTGPATSLLYALDGVVLVTRPGGATEFRLHRWLRRIDPHRRLGVLLVE
jgi:NAD(P)-dependent dehydrogenase (short-subunit alcohol dehydrogenase family)